MKKFFENVALEVSYFFIVLGEEVAEFLSTSLYMLGLCGQALLTVGISLGIIFGGGFAVLWVIKQLILLFV